MSAVRGRPPRLAGGTNGAVSAHSASVISDGYRSPSRLCSRRAIPVHVTIHSISSQRGVNHNMLVLLNNFRFGLLLTGGAAPLAVILTGAHAGQAFDLANLRSGLNLVCEDIEIVVDPATLFRPAYVQEPIGAIHLANGITAISCLIKDRYGFKSVQLVRFNAPQIGEPDDMGETIGFKSWRIVKRFKDEVVALLDFDSTLTGDR